MSFHVSGSELHTAKWQRTCRFLQHVGMSRTTSYVPSYACVQWQCNGHVAFCIAPDLAACVSCVSGDRPVATEAVSIGVGHGCKCR